jgi:hypothetical protein
MFSNNVLDLIDFRAGFIDDWLSIDGEAVGGETDVRVEISTSLVYPPVWSAWQRIERDEVTARHVRARAVLTSNDVSYTPVVTKLRLYADEAI